jgi:CxxC-x17-CxxC domain-containing protein
MSEITQRSADVQMSCCDCGREFTFTRGEQAFYAEHRLQAPRRCRACRVTRKTTYTTYADSTRGGKREKFHASCADCGQDALLPFEPQAGRPVYCSACFEACRLAAHHGAR